MQNIKRQQGFFTIAQNSPTGDYIRMAYALALSLKATQPNIPFLSIGVADASAVPEKYVHAFDEIVEIPWSDMAAGEPWKLSNEWKVPFMSPYRETIKLDADMLFTSNIEHWWNIVGRNGEVAICSNSTTYRGDISNDERYRKVFRENNYPNAYSALTYFTREHEAFMFFKQCEHLFKEWKDFDWVLNDFLQEPKATTDVVYAMASILENKPSYFAEPFFSFVHMKPLCQNVEQTMVDGPWTDYIPYTFTPNLELYIGNFKQLLPVHYHNKAFLTDEIIGYYEEKLGV